MLILVRAWLNHLINKESKLNQTIPDVKEIWTRFFYFAKNGANPSSRVTEHEDKNAEVESNAFKKKNAAIEKGVIPFLIDDDFEKVFTLCTLASQFHASKLSDIESTIKNFLSITDKVNDPSKEILQKILEIIERKD